MKSENDIKKANLIGNAKSIREVFANMPLISEQTGLLLLGTTGSGKSTIANYLLETPLIRWDDDLLDTIDESVREKYKIRQTGEVYPRLDFENRADLPQIGAGLSSKTINISSYRTVDGMLFFDTPGFIDTNQNRRLANSLALEEIIQQSKKIKLAIVIDYWAVRTGRGELFKSLAKLLGDLLPSTDLNHHEKQNNMLFLFINKVGSSLNQSALRKAVENAESALILEQESAISLDALKLLEVAIKVCKAIIRTPDTHLIFVDPIDDGISRSLIYQSLESLQALEAKLFHFNTTERLDFNKELTTTFITPHLQLMYRESIHHELRNMNEEHHARLLAYEKLSLTYKEKMDVVDADLAGDKQLLQDSESDLEILRAKLNSVEKYLNDDLRPDEEIEFAIMRGDEHSLSAVEAVSTGVAYTAGTVVGAAALSYGLLGIIAGIVSGDLGYMVDMLSDCYDGFHSFFRFVKYGICDTFTVGYTGDVFTRTEIRYESIPIGLLEPYYKIHTDRITESTDKRECTVRFQKKFLEKAPAIEINENLSFDERSEKLEEMRRINETLCIIGKRENHSQLRPIITAARSEIAKLKMEVTKCENRIAMLKKIINILTILQKSSNESELEERIKHFQLKDTTIEENWQESLQVLMNIQDELEAVSTILTYVSIPGILTEYQERYQIAQEHLSLFIKQPHISAEESSDTSLLSSFYRAKSGQTLFEGASALLQPIASASNSDITVNLKESLNV